MFTWQDVEKLKAAGRYQHAGQLAAILGYDTNMGCHYGMQSQVETARELFRHGWKEINSLHALHKFTEAETR